MMRVVHLNYHCHHDITQPSEVIAIHRLSSGFIQHFSRVTDFISVKHLQHQGALTDAGVNYHFFKSRNRTWYIPFRTHRFVKKQKPDVVLVEGFVFPLQVLFLRWKLGKSPVIIAQHHGEKPWKGVKGFLQRIASPAVDAYVFTSLGNAGPWIEKGIGKKETCFEVLSASTSLQPMDRQQSKNKLGWKDDLNFLWVGRLVAVKDPMTVLKGFAGFCEAFPSAQLHMIYQSDELLPEIKHLLQQDERLAQAVILYGKKENSELPLWYSAADFFISGSRSEGSGYALVEAMTCGCIPIVTRIPSFVTITANGMHGILYEAGNPVDLLQKLLHLPRMERKERHAAIQDYSARELSPDRIAGQLQCLCQRLLRE